MEASVIMSTAYKTLDSLTKLGRQYDRNIMDNREMNPFYQLNGKEMTIILRRRGEKFEYEWLETTKKIAVEEGYPKCEVSLNDEGYLQVSFLKE